MPLTFGQVFVQGEVGSSESITGTLADGTPLGLQIDAKASHADGSLRHAVISTVLPQLAAGQSQTIKLVKTAAYTATPSATALADLLNGGFDARVNLTIGGVAYSVSAKDLLQLPNPTKWLVGPSVNEWLVSAPLKTAGGVVHPHLVARFAIRAYAGINKAKVDVIVENGWAYEPNPQDFTYDVQVEVGGQTVYSNNALTHYHHARWRKSFWWGTAPLAHIKHNTAYLIASKAVPNYDQSITISETGLANLKMNFDAASIEPMGNGIATPYMPTTGGRPEIGLIPGWGAMTVLSMDKRAKDVTLGMGDLSGSWPTHYRDKVTGRPISLADYPYMTLNGPSSDSFNPTANRNEALPGCTTVCNNPNVADTAHQPAFNYLPYLLTGEHYYLEELLFYTMWSVGGGHPVYRQLEQGLVASDQVRGQAWTLRNVVDAAYVLPDSDPMKAQFNAILAANLAWFNTTYTTNASANVFGALTNGYAFSYNNETGIAPWQDDFFTSVIGHAAERNFSGAPALLAWKAKFPVGRMADAGFCWVMGSVYTFNMRPTNTSPFFTTYAQVYQATLSAALRATACGSAAMAQQIQLEDPGTPMIAGAMVGYPQSSMGFPANMQPALAYAKDSGIANAATAWSIFNQRQMKPDYSTDPQFAIVPR
ncbi:hypothetical protein D3878_10180 [Noviherbaspirillum sedimenti]|uniref:Uncharacterized protein n=1 Tax=Noviherbaspirillum sedimenti TaxID=2320865 RepID=A0A3A3G972_9BURK|nr:hypothetical protein D3878_10180 [Noviherbaspirillum sedimenti]